MIGKWVAAALMVAFWCAMSPAWAIGTGEPAPDYRIRLTNGTIFSREAGAGKVVVLHFWASWCVPCRSEMPAIESYYRKHHGQGLEFIAISMDDPADLAKVRDILGRYSYPGALARDAEVRGYGRIWRIPLTFVIDRRGLLRLDAWSGGDDGLTEALLEAAITPLLNDQPAF